MPGVLCHLLQQAPQRDTCRKGFSDMLPACQVCEWTESPLGRKVAINPSAFLDIAHIMRLLFSLVTLVLLALPVWAQSGSQPLADALLAMKSADWDRAAHLARRDGRLAADIIEWHRLRAGHGSYSDTISFLRRNPDWPGLAYLRRKSEANVITSSHANVRGFFSQQAPQTPAGVLSYARALENAGQGRLAREVVIAAFKTMQMSASEQANFLTPYGQTLAPHIWHRLDYMLWQGWTDNASRLLALVSDRHKALAKARIALRKRQKNGVNALINGVPGGLKNDPGLAYERFLWRARAGQANALDMLLERSRSARSLGQPENWAGRRRSLARDQMRKGNYQTAYRIASAHFITPSGSYSNYADLEWLSGYLALRFLNKPQTALQHFDRFTSVVFTPISLGRSGYWRGRAYQALGNQAAAQAAYDAGARHQTSFYGLLAAEKAGIASDPALTGNEKFPSWRAATWTRTSVHKAAMLLLDAGEISLAERFWTHLSESQGRQALGQMGQMAIDLGSPHIAVMLGKRMVRQGVTLPGPYYALHPMMKNTRPVPVELSLSIARRESEFDPVVVSGAGARGLMQVMPGTAKLVARQLGIRYSVNKLLSDPEYNARLGSEYLAMMADRFNGNIMMVAAAYNAGPGRPERWMATYGDPRRGAIDAVDWVEHIPFNETRNYVMRVAESLPIYRARMGRNPLPIPFSKELVGSTVKRRR